MANRFNNSSSTNIGTTLAEVYGTGATKKATVIGINLANLLTTTVTADIVLELADTTQVYIVKGVVIPAGNSLAAIGGDQKLVMIENNKILVKSSDATSIDAVVSTLEVIQ
jgi:hypothetical protein